MLREPGEGEPQLTGNDMFQGFCVDLLKQIAEEINFKYKIKLVSDGMYGSEIKGTDKWNGMVQELRDGVSVLVFFIIHPCDPTVMICYLIWPCGIAVCITYTRFSQLVP